MAIESDSGILSKMEPNNQMIVDGMTPNQRARLQAYITQATAYYAADWRGLVHDYSKFTNYRNQTTKGIIICVLHGEEFMQGMDSHSKGYSGCGQCPGHKGEFRKFSLARMIQSSIRVHGEGMYDYTHIQQYTMPVNVKSEIYLYCNTCGDNFFTTFDSHIYHGSGCISCANVKKGLSNYVKGPIETHNLALMRPDIAAQLHPQHNAYQLTPCTHTPVTWICPRGHDDYIMQVSSRTARIKPQSCPTCGNRRICDETRLTNNPDAVAQWDHVKNTRKIEQCTMSAAYKAHFICDCIDADGVPLKHEYEMFLYSFHVGERCPYKSGRRVDASNSFLAKMPDIVNYWDDANVSGPHEFTYGSGKQCWLKCVVCATRWLTTPNALRCGISCPKCCPTRYSKISIQWLDSLKIEDMQHALRGGEHHIGTSRLRADGYSPSTNTIYEFHGTYWHGDPRVYDAEAVNTVCGKTFGRLYEDTCARENFIKQLGYNLVVMWELDYMASIQ